MTIKRRHQAGAGASGPGAPTSKADLAYETILQSIREGEYAPGQRLVFEQMARALGVSVVPIREAIRRLEADGFVTFTRNVGATVASTDVDGSAETLETIASLEGIALGLAAPHVTSGAISRARAVNERLRSVLAGFDAARFRRVDRRFHDVLLAACPNTHLLAVLERERAFLDATGTSTLAVGPGRARRCVDEHDDVLDLIETRTDPDAIERWAREHRLRDWPAALGRTVVSSTADGAGRLDRRR